MGMKQIALKMGDFMSKNSPYILTGLGVAGVVSTAVATGYSTVKAIDVLNKEKMRQASLKQKFMLTWKLYLPPVFAGAASIACIIGANSVNTKRNAALAGLYSLSEATLKRYQDKVVETLGENKAEGIKDEIAQDILLDNETSNTAIINTGRGNMLCFDVMSGRYFLSDIEVIRRIVNDLNHDLLGVMWVPLNDFYYAMGLEGVKMGDELGWTVDELIDIQFRSRLADDKTPCLVLDYDLTPRHLKTKFMSGL